MRWMGMAREEEARGIGDRLHPVHSSRCLSGLVPGLFTYVRTV